MAKGVLNCSLGNKHACLLDDEDYPNTKTLLTEEAKRIGDPGFVMFDEYYYSVSSSKSKRDHIGRQRLHNKYNVHSGKNPSVSTPIMTQSVLNLTIFVINRQESFSRSSGTT
jgi:hypothetical protein